MGERSVRCVDDNFEVGSTSPVPLLGAEVLLGSGRAWAASNREYRPMRGTIKWTGETLATIFHYDSIQIEAT